MGKKEKKGEKKKKDGGDSDRAALEKEKNLYLTQIEFLTEQSERWGALTRSSLFVNSLTRYDVTLLYAYDMHGLLFSNVSELPTNKFVVALPDV